MIHSSRVRTLHPFLGFFILATLAVTLLTSCATSAPPPEPRYYRLPSSQLDLRVNAPLGSTLAVDRFHATGPYAERPIIYVQADTPLILRRYHYHLWAMPPAELLQESLIARLRDTGLAERVTRDPGVSGAGRVTGRVLRLEREVGTDGAVAVVELELGYLPPGSGDGGWNRIYRSEARPSGDDMHALVEAFGYAVEDVYLSYLNDLSASLEKSR